jgi:hypothetical protein
MIYLSCGRSMPGKALRVCPAAAVDDRTRLAHRRSFTDARNWVAARPGRLGTSHGANPAQVRRAPFHQGQRRLGRLLDRPDDEAPISRADLPHDHRLPSPGSWSRMTSRRKTVRSSSGSRMGPGRVGCPVLLDRPADPAGCGRHSSAGSVQGHQPVQDATPILPRGGQHRAQRAAAHSSPRP